MLEKCDEDMGSVLSNPRKVSYNHGGRERTAVDEEFKYPNSDNETNGIRLDKHVVRDPASKEVRTERFKGSNTHPRLYLPKDSARDV